MRIALTSFAFSEYAIRLATALSADHEVALWVSAADAAPHLGRVRSDIDLHVFDRPRMRNPIGSLRRVGQIIDEVRAFRPDVFHLQQGYLWLNPLLGRFGDTPIIITVHDPVPHLGDRNGQKTPRFINDLGFRRADHLIAHNTQMRDLLVARGHPADKISIAPMVVLGDADDLAACEDDGRTVLFFGRIWGYKGLQHLIGSQPAINAEVPDARFVIAGEGEDFDKYRNLMSDVQRFEVHNRYISNEEVAELFGRASVVVLPYIEATQSGVIVTAYNFGKPVVATTVGGLPSMVADGETGLLVPPGDEEALAKAVVKILTDDHLRARLGMAARARALKEFAAETVARRTVEIYESVASTSDVTRSD